MGGCLTAGNLGDKMDLLYKVFVEVKLVLSTFLKFRATIDTFDKL